MSFTVFLGNLPVWVTKDDIKAWLNAESLVFDDVKVIRNPETQESKGFAFIDAPNSEEMSSIIRRFDRAPLEDRLLRANQAQPPKARTQAGPPPRSAPQPHIAHTAPIAQTAHAAVPHSAPSTVANAASQAGTQTGTPAAQPAPDRNGRRERGGKKHKRPNQSHQGPQSAFAEELAKAL
jgi:RNA recognition motif-containing protein